MSPIKCIRKEQFNINNIITKYFSRMHVSHLLWSMYNEYKHLTNFANNLQQHYM